MNTRFVKNLAAGLVLAAAIVGGSGSAIAQKKVAGSQIIKFDPPDSVGTFPQQILNSGIVVGYYVDTHTAHGFLRSVDGKYTTIDVPNAAGTQAFGINDEGTVVGWWFEPPAGNGSVYHGFLRYRNGNLTYFDVPGAGPYQPQSPSPIVVIQLPLAINRDGTVAGSYLDPQGVNHGFVRSVDGNITSFDPSGSVNTLGDTNGINREGTISGAYFTFGGVIHGFVRDADGTITSFDGPGAGTTTGNGSVAEMINDAGTIPGVSLDNNGLNHAFIRYNDGTYVIFGVKGAGTGPGQGTLATAANVAGITAGTYVDENGVNHGFVRSRQGKITTFDVPGEGTGSGQGVFTVGSINEEGAVEGWYIDGNGANHGFIYQYRGEDDSNFPGTGLTADSAQPATVNFLPEDSGNNFGRTTGSTQRGSRTATLSIVDNATGSPQMFWLSSTATVVEFNPASLSFGVVQVGQSKTLATTLTNTGSGTLSITGITLSNAWFSQFNTCGSSVGPGRSCAISVTMRPTFVQTERGELSISDNGGGSPQQVSLSGSGVASVCRANGATCGYNGQCCSDRCLLSVHRCENVR